MTNSMTMRHKSVKALVALLQNTSDPTTVAIMEYFQPYCDCSVSLWLIEEINNGNVDVINKIRELIENEDPTPFTRELIYPGSNFLLRTFCQGSDLYGVYADGVGSGSNSLIVLNSNKCSNYFILDSLKGSSGQLFSHMPEIGLGYPATGWQLVNKTADHIVTPDGLRLTTFNAAPTGGYMEMYSRTTGCVNETVIPTNNVEAGISLFLKFKEGTNQLYMPDQTWFHLSLEVPPDEEADQWSNNQLTVVMQIRTVRNFNNTRTISDSLDFLVFTKSPEGLQYTSYTGDSVRTNWDVFSVPLNRYAAVEQAMVGEFDNVMLEGSPLPKFLSKRHYNVNGVHDGYEVKLKLITNNGSCGIYVNDSLVLETPYNYGNPNTIPAGGVRAGFGRDEMIYGSDYDQNGDIIIEYTSHTLEELMSPTRLLTDFYVKPV